MNYSNDNPICNFTAKFGFLSKQQGNQFDDRLSSFVPDSPICICDNMEICNLSTKPGTSESIATINQQIGIKSFSTSLSGEIRRAIHVSNGDAFFIDYASVSELFENRGERTILNYSNGHSNERNSEYHGFFHRRREDNVQNISQNDIIPKYEILPLPVISDELISEVFNITKFLGIERMPSGLEDEDVPCISQNGEGRRNDISAVTNTLNNKTLDFRNNRNFLDISNGDNAVTRPAKRNAGVNCRKNKRFFCEICKKSYVMKSSLDVHLRSHTDENTHGCNICFKKFVHPSHLKKHRRVHMGEKPYGCDICGKNFTQSSNLVTHLRIHTGEKPFICDICGKRFNDSGHARRHRRIHIL